MERVQVHDFLWSLGKLERVYTARSTCSDRSATMDKTKEKVDAAGHAGAPLLHPRARGQDIEQEVANG